MNVALVLFFYQFLHYSVSSARIFRCIHFSLSFSDDRLKAAELFKTCLNRFTRWISSRRCGLNNDRRLSLMMQREKERIVVFYEGRLHVNSSPINFQESLVALTRPPDQPREGARTFSNLSGPISIESLLLRA